MVQLNENWLTEGLVDYEYKKYILLAYLKQVKESFTKIELYPFLSDLVFHHRNLIAIRENKSMFYNRFPSRLSLEHLQNLEINYKKIIEDDAVMHEIESIIEFALPQFKSSLDEGSFIYEYVESQCEISPVGLTSLYAKEGYLFVTQPPQNETNIYRYQLTIFDNVNEKLRGIHTQLISTSERSFTNTHEQMKLKLIRQFSDLPNPATYLVVSKLKFHIAQTLMPIAKRLLIKKIEVA